MSDAEDIIKFLNQHYNSISMDWSGEILCGTTLQLILQRWTILSDHR